MVAAPVPLGRLHFVNHLPNWQLDFERERERQAVRLATRLEQLVEEDPGHVIVVGDLDGDSVCYRDAWESVNAGEDGETFTQRNTLLSDPDWPFRRIDQVLVRCGEHGGPTLRIVSCERVLDRAEDGIWASDHFGLTAELAAHPEL
jgi:endonuclease/exonuclease/phosphatase family metal-dependent hydrolase